MKPTFNVFITMNPGRFHRVTSLVNLKVFVSTLSRTLQAMLDVQSFPTIWQPFSGLSPDFPDAALGLARVLAVRMHIPRP